MSGDVANVATWANADVLIGDITATPPTLDGHLFVSSSDLKFLGLVTPDGFTEAQSHDSTDIPAFTDAGIVATVRGNNVITVAVNALEDNVEAYGLRYDASGLTAADSGPGYSGVTKARDLSKQFLLGFQLATGSLVKQRFTEGWAEIDSVGDAQESKTGVLQTQLVFKIYANNAKEYWDNYFGPIVTGA